MNFLITLCAETLSATWAIQASRDVEFIAFFAENDHFRRMSWVLLKMILATFFTEIEFRCSRGIISWRRCFTVETRY